MQKNNNIYKELDEKIIELTDLFEICKALNSSLNLKSILDTFLRIPMGRMMINRGLVLLKKENDNYEIKTLKGLSRDLIGKSLKINDFPNNTFIIDEIDNTSKWVDFFKSKKISIITPLIAQNNLLGLAGWGEKIVHKSYSEKDIEFLESLSNIAASAIDNSLVYEELRKVNRRLDNTVQQLNTLFDIGKEFSLILDRDKIIKLLSYSLMGQMMINKFALFMIENENIELIHNKGIKGFEDAKTLNLCLEELNNVRKLEFSLSVEENIEAFESLNKCGVSLIIPMKIQDELRGMILIGKKIDGSKFKQEDKEFLSLLSNQAMIALENARLFDETLEKQRLEEEINFAREIQQKLLPKSVKGIRGYDVSAVNVPSRQVGGDYFDVLSHNENTLSIIIADVSGKGIPASLLMSNLQASMKALIKIRQPIPDMVSKVNDIIYENTDLDKYITFFYGKIDSL